jgi:hypothetical protein
MHLCNFPSSLEPVSLGLVDSLLYCSAIPKGARIDLAWPWFDGSNCPRKSERRSSWLWFGLLCWSSILSHVSIDRHTLHFVGRPRLLFVVQDEKLDDDFQSQIHRSRIDWNTLEFSTPTSLDRCAPGTQLHESSTGKLSSIALGCNQYPYLYN